MLFTPTGCPTSPNIFAGANVAFVPDGTIQNPKPRKKTARLSRMDLGQTQGTIYWITKRMNTESLHVS